MAVIVRHKENGEIYILLGGGFGTWKSRVPHVFFGSWAPSDESGEVPVALICDYAGKVGWIHTSEIEVLSVDGESPREVLDRHPAEPT